MADIIIQPPGRPISYHPELTKLVGSVKAAVLLQQITYWTPRAHDADGWIYKSEKAWMEEISYTLKELRGAMQELLSRKLIKREYDRGRHELRVQLQVETYNSAIQRLCEQMPKQHMPKQHMPKRHMLKGKVAHAKMEPATCQKGTCPNNVVSRDDPEIKATPPSPSRKWTRFPPDWHVSPEMLADFQARFLALDIALEEENLRDWEFKEAKTDPAATWRRWMREAAKRLPQSHSRPASRLDRPAELEL